MKANHWILFAENILGRGNSQRKGPEADGDWLVLNSIEAGVANSRVSKRTVLAIKECGFCPK